MTNKDDQLIKIMAIFMVGLILGLLIGTIITSLRYDAEIRTDQVELKDQIAEIVEDEAVINDLISELLSQVESVKAERKSIEALRKKLSKGE